MYVKIRMTIDDVGNYYEEWLTFAHNSALYPWSRAAHEAEIWCSAYKAGTGYSASIMAMQEYTGDTPITIAIQPEEIHQRILKLTRRSPS